jgi:hypothetical protein
MRFYRMISISIILFVAVFTAIYAQANINTRVVVNSSLPDHSMVVTNTNPTSLNFIAVKGISRPAAFYGYGGWFEGGNLGVYGYGNYAGTNGFRIGVYGLANGGSTGYGIFGYSSGATTNYAGYFSGDLAYTGNLTKVSDEKFKKEIKSMDRIVDKVIKLNPTSYQYKTDEYPSARFSTGKEYGLIAQEVENIFPEIVKDGSMPVVDPKTGTPTQETIAYKGVDYVALIPILVQAIKDQQQEIEDLKATAKK